MTTNRAVSIENCCDLFSVLADPVRAHIVQMLADGTRCACDLIEESGVSQPTVSHHLKALKEAGLVEAHAVGRYTHYRLRPEALARAIEELAHLSASAARREFEQGTSSMTLTTTKGPT